MKWLMKHKREIMRVVVVALLLFALFPVLTKILFSNTPYLYKALEQNLWLLGVTVLAFLVISHSKIKSNKYGLDCVLVIVGLFFIIGGAYSLVNIDSLPHQSLKVKGDYGFGEDRQLNKGWIDLESARVLSFAPLNVRVPVYGIYLMDSNSVVRKKIILNEVFDDLTVAIHLSWQNSSAVVSSFGEKDNNYVGLVINGNEFDVSDSVFKSEEYEGLWIYVSVPASYFVEGENIISVKSRPGDKVVRVSEIVSGNVSSVIGSSGLVHENDNLLVFISGDRSFFYEVGSLLKVIGLLLIFIGCAGIRWKDVVKTKKELLFSIVLLNAFFYLSFIAKEYWFVLSKAVSWINQTLFVILGIPSTLELDNLSAPVFHIKDFFVSISTPCSGIVSLNYFMIAIVVMLIVNWKEIDFKKALFVVPLGIIGMFMINVLRVFLLLIIGAYYSQEVAMGIFHTSAGMILFIIYFGIFWLYGWKYMRKS
jgi:exosortase/archaeosortase family protein